MTAPDPSIKDQLATYIGVGEPEPIEPEPALALAATERVTWSGTETARWPLALGLLGATAGLVLLAYSPLNGLVVLVAGLVALVFARIHVVASARGVRVRFAWLPWPSKFVAIDDIAQAAAIDLRPTEWGGWGYRIARPAKGFSRTAVVLRGGEALHLTRRNGREFAVTVRGAADAAAVVNAYVEADPAS